MPISTANLKTLRVNPDWATLPLFDRTGWTKVRFGEVVRVLKEQVDPASGEVERYVAGEHMDSENVHIRRWGIVGDGYLGPAFIRRFRKGQVLYGSRRTYLKKVAIAEWDGVTANTTFVLEAVEGRLLQGLLPWLMLSERFTKHSIQESKGSTNPYINWPDIAKFEFDLPPLDQQRRIAEILWTLDEAVQRCLETGQAADLHRQATVAAFVSGHRSCETRLADHLGEVQYGSSSKCELTASSRLVPVLRIPNVIGGRVDFSDLVWLELTEDAFKYRLVRGDVLIVRTNGNPDYVGRTAVYDGSQFDECLFASYLIRLRPKADSLLPHFLDEMLRSERLRKAIRKQVKSSAGNYNLNTQGIRGLSIPLPSTQVQREFLDGLASVDAVISALARKVDALRSLRSVLLNSPFIVGMP